MKVLITGGAGFLGQRLARALLERGTLCNARGEAEAIDRIVLVDVVRANDAGDPRVTTIAGDIADAALVDRLVDASVTSVFHLAAVVSGEAERDFELGLRVNLDATRLLLDACRRRGRACAEVPRVVFTSSVAVYGGVLPEVVLDTTALAPRSSYGVQKAIGELLLSDYGRRGFVDGRVARLPTISVRPGRPNQAASSFASGIVREPLAGEEAVCPVAPETRLWLLSPHRAIDHLIALHDLPAARLGDARIVNLPGLSVSVAEMVEALRAVAGDEAVARIRWQRDPVVERIVGGWPARWDVARAAALGLAGDADFASIIRAHLADTHGPLLRSKATG